MAGRTKILVLGYGNPGRRDDGLGPALAAALELLNLPGVAVDADYQLTVEDAAAVAEHDVVVFADADLNGPAPFSFRRLSLLSAGDGGGPAPARAGHPSLSFSSHSASPEAVLALAEELFGARPEAYLLGIRGYEFNAFGEGLSAPAQANLAAALAYITLAVREKVSGTFFPALSDFPGPVARKRFLTPFPAKGETR